MRADEAPKEFVLNHSGIIKEFIVPDANDRYCETCGLPCSRVKLMRVPELPGLYCSILCAEQGIAERGCQWCGGKLPEDAHGGQKFCSESCKDLAASNPIGNRKRLITWLTKYAPELLYGAGLGEYCAHCNAPLTGKRRGSKFCNDTCSKAYRRENPIHRDLSRTDPAVYAGPARAENRVKPSALGRA